MTKTLFFLIHLPILAGVLLLFLKNNKFRSILAALVLLLGLIAASIAFFKIPGATIIRLFSDYSFVVSLSRLSKFILLFINFFGFLLCIYSFSYFEVEKRRTYYSLLLWLIAFSSLACLSSDFLLFVFSWGAILAILYALLSLGSGYSANKALSILGFADFCLLAGIGLYVSIIGTTVMPVGAVVTLDSPISWAAFLLMTIGALAKAGCMPFHTWIPTASERAPIPVMAILPASLDKLLGIYLLSRVCVDFFVLNNAALFLLLMIASLTIMIAVMMALIQHDLRKLLSYHAVSQVGYMVLGFACANPIGIAGGLLHMLNNSIYKTGLFLTGGNVGQKKKVFELDKLGALAALMPATFVCALVFALSISGIPPFNGFASKWMLYQGTILGFTNAINPFMRFAYLFALICAMFGSALTLASFIKFIHAIFLGQDKEQVKKREEAPLNMVIPLVILGIFCLLLGLFPYLALRELVEPWIFEKILFIGNWSSILAILLLIAGLFFGLLFWRMLKGRKIRQDDLFLGGENISYGPSFPATEFYKTVENTPGVKTLYKAIKFEPADLFNLLIGAVGLIGKFSLRVSAKAMDMIVAILEFINSGIKRFSFIRSNTLEPVVLWCLFIPILLLLLRMVF